VINSKYPTVQREEAIFQAYQSEDGLQLLSKFSDQIPDEGKSFRCVLKV
jgi:hypothetical protein